jgi:3-oxoacyl-[acyl-carrier-protein] synthase-3
MRFDNVYITSTGAYFPGEPVGNDDIDRYIAPINAMSPRIKRRILGENGILTRHYALDEHGRSTHTCAALAANAVRACLGGDADAALRDIDLLAAATSSGDLILPGFANMLQAELRAPAMTTASHHGVCASGMSALQHAALALQHGQHRQAVVAAAEFPSRLFKRSRFAPGGYNADFDAHFLRWMLSDGAGAWRLSTQPGAGIALKLEHLHLKSFSGELPLCMQAGQAPDGSLWGDHEDFTAADAAGAMLLRQDIRLLPQLFDVATHEYVKLAQSGAIDPATVDHFLCHYSSERFAPVVKQCLQLAQLDIPEHKWYSNLKFRGNLGSASIFTMLDDFLRERKPQPGQNILLFVPESGRFTVAFALLKVVDADTPATLSSTATKAQTIEPAVPLPAPPHSADDQQLPEVARLLRELALVWHDYRSRVWQTPLVGKILDGSVGKPDYVNWMEQWVPQVRQGSLWMRKAADHLTPKYAVLRDTVHHHADDEQLDYNPGGEALNAYLHARAAQPDALGLLGAMYIIEGTGQRIVPALLPLLRQRLGWLGRSFNFLAYHGENDVAHLQRWLAAVETALAIGGRDIADDIVDDARHVATLYARQLEMIR